MISPNRTVSRTTYVESTMTETTTVTFTDAEKKRFEDPVQARELRLALEHNMNVNSRR